MKLIITALTVLFLSSSVEAKDGANVPWPWPWAKECPIDFEYLNGTYVVKQSSEVDFIEIDTGWDVDQTIHYISIKLYNQDFDLLSEGSTYTWNGTRSIYIPMKDISGERQPGLRLQFYHRSEKQSCERKELIPILTVADKGVPGSREPEEQMVLEPMANWDEESP